MGNLADFIEQYLRNIIIQQQKVELQRRELAKMFRCAPSQINYVLETRFTFERGYLVESKRGGGGYIRITPVPWDPESDFLHQIEALIPPTVDTEQASDLLQNLAEKEVISSDEAIFCQEMLKRYFSDLPEDLGDRLRANLVKVILLVLGLRTRE